MAFMLGLDDDVRELVYDEVKGALSLQRLAEVNLFLVTCLFLCGNITHNNYSIISSPALYCIGLG